MISCSVWLAIFPLYLGEISFRFDHDDEDFFPPGLQLMKRTSNAAVEPLLVRFA